MALKVYTPFLTKIECNEMRSNCKGSTFSLVIMHNTLRIGPALV